MTDTMNSEQLLELVTTALDDMKAQNIRTIDVRGKTTLTDFMVIASGTSGRHVQSTAESVATEAKQAGIPPLGVEGQESQEWVLVDLNDVIVHVMLPETRDFYNLEKLWMADEAADTEKAAPEDPSLERVRRLRR